MKHLDLFSGIGGFALAARNVGWQTVAFCEIDPYCRAVLRKHWPGVPIHSDVRELTGDAVGHVDIITGGYPCQPFSLAGERRGEADDRHLWPHFARLIRELRPRWTVGENVAGHISMGLDDVLADLEGLGYAWEAFVIPAVAVDARHRRDRLWIVADAGSGDEPQIATRDGSERGQRSTIGRRAEFAAGARASGGARRGDAATGDDRREFREISPALADADKRRREGVRSFGVLNNERQTFGNHADRCDSGLGKNRAQWAIEPSLGRMADGIPDRAHRLRALGNAIVPQVAEEIFRAIDAIR